MISGIRPHKVWQDRDGNDEIIGRKRLERAEPMQARDAANPERSESSDVS